MQASMMKQNIVLDGKGIIATGAAVALLDKNGSMCAFGDVGPEYNCLPLAVTNVAGTEDAASADQYGWILPFALTRHGENSRATAVRALRACVSVAVDESALTPLALWECAWPAHPNKGACCTHELFVVWMCQLAQSTSNISVLVHGERQYTWIPTKYALQSLDRRNGFVPHLKRAQSEFCKPHDYHNDLTHVRQHEREVIGRPTALAAECDHANGGGGAPAAVAEGQGDEDAEDGESVPSDHGSWDSEQHDLANAEGDDDN